MRLPLTGNTRRMMKNRKIYLVIVSIITLLSTHQLIDLYIRFRFLVVDILNNLTQSVVMKLARVTGLHQLRSKSFEFRTLVPIEPL
jgi:hypothetical protein